MLKLDNQLCFSIYACSREITKLYRPMLDEMNLTYPQYLVLLVLWEQAHCTVKELGERLFLDSGTLTPMLKRMESAGFINRTRASDDERKVMITVTDKGLGLKDQAYCIPESLLLRIGSNPEEYQQMMRMFQRILDAVHTQTEGAR